MAFLPRCSALFLALSTIFVPYSVALAPSIPLKHLRHLKRHKWCAPPTSSGPASNGSRTRQESHVKLYSYPIWTISQISDSFFLSRIVFIRALAFVYGVAFLIARRQNIALIGDNGITPARYVLNKAEEKARAKRESRRIWLEQQDGIERRSRQSTSTKLSPHKEKSRALFNAPLKKDVFSLKSFARLIGMRINKSVLYQHWRERLWDRRDRADRAVTTLLWLAKDRKRLNPWLNGISTCGLLISFAVFIMGAANIPLMLSLWVCQRSLMSVGGPWYGYGWEPQLAELGSHAIFLVPAFSLAQIPFNVVGDVVVASRPSPIIIFAIRWHLFRIMIGAGLIKLKSRDQKWKWPKLSAMEYFYETQPVLNPLSRYFHWMPKWWHKFEVLVNHFVEIIVPVLLIIPFQSLRRAGGITQIAFQAVLIISGNLSFLNWLTIVPAIMCLDDSLISGMFPLQFRLKGASAAHFSCTFALRRITSLFFGALVAYLSIPVVRNLASKRQVMNSSFEPYRLISTYGAFGTVEETREEFVVSATSDLDSAWKEYEFKVKPGDIMKRPSFLSPYHYRIDWQMWIASACKTIDYGPWIFNFLRLLLEQDSEVLKLLKEDPFKGEQIGPKYIRVDRYCYRLHRPQRNNSKPLPYWDREYIGRVYPRQGVISLADLREIVRDNE